MCDPEINDGQAKLGLRQNMVDYDPCCGKTAAELLLIYCAEGMIKKHVTVEPAVGPRAAEPLLPVGQETCMVTAPENP